MKTRIMLLCIPGVLLALSVTPLLSDSPGTSPEYNRQAARLNKQEAGELAKLADWCQKNGLDRRARGLAARALAIDPQHARATAVMEQLRQAIRAPGTQEVELLLVDGSRLLGRTSLREVILRSEYGILRFPLEEMQLVAFAFAGQQDLVIADGLSMIGRAGVGTFETTTKVGQVAIGEHNLKQIQVVRPCDTCDGKRKIVCLECKGKGISTVKRPCPTCNGVDSKKKCARCEGRGAVQCDVCIGRGSWRIPRMGFDRRVECPKCKGTGEVACPDCKGVGEIICPTCKGTGSISETGVCPVCRGTKIQSCPACEGAGKRPTPKPVWPIRPKFVSDIDGS